MPEQSASNPGQLPALNLVQAPQIENIEIIKLLGRGGVSLVYLAKQVRLNRLVALKVLSKQAIADSTGLQRFQNEAKLASKVDHPNIVKYISFGVSKDGQPYLVMEYIEGQSLAESLTQNGPLQVQQFKDIFLPALRALDQAHSAGLVHRDIKPANIMLCRGNDSEVNDTIKILDFGIAKIFSQTDEANCGGLTATGILLGTPQYMSPEQCKGAPLDGRSDIYSIACVMYESLTGTQLFSGSSILDVMQKQMHEAPPTVAKLKKAFAINSGLADAVLKGLAKDPASLGPQSAGVFAIELGAALDLIPSSETIKITNRAPVLRRKSIACIIALLFVLFGSAFATFLYKATRVPSQAPLSIEAKAKKKNTDKFAEDLERIKKRHMDPKDTIKAARDFYSDHGNLQLEAHYQNLLVAYERSSQHRDSFELSLDLASLANCLLRLDAKGNDAEAKKLLSQAFQESISLAANSRLTANRLNYLGGICMQHLRLAEAEQAFKTALSICRKSKLVDEDQLVDSICRLANCYSVQGRLTKSEALYTEALSRSKKAENDDYVAPTLLELASCYVNDGKFAKATPYIDRFFSLSGEDGLAPSLATPLYHLANAYVNKGLFSNAKPIAERLLEAERSVSMRSPYIELFALETIAKYYGKNKDFKDLDALPSSVGDEPLLLLLCKIAVANCYRELGLLDKAKQFIDDGNKDIRVEKIKTSDGRIVRIILASSQMNLAIALLKEKQEAIAGPLIESSLESARREAKPGDHNLIADLTALSDCYAGRQQSEKANEVKKLLLLINEVAR